MFSLCVGVVEGKSGFQDCHQFFKYELPRPTEECCVTAGDVYTDVEKGTVFTSVIG
jgi:hypothetical protein